MANSKLPLNWFQSFHIKLHFSSVLFSYMSTDDPDALISLSLTDSLIHSSASSSYMPYNISTLFMVCFSPDTFLPFIILSSFGMEDPTAFVSFSVQWLSPFLPHYFSIQVTFHLLSVFTPFLQAYVSVISSHSARTAGSVYHHAQMLQLIK